MAEDTTKVSLMIKRGVFSRRFDKFFSEPGYYREIPYFRMQLLEPVRDSLKIICIMLRKEEVENVSKLDPFKRYQYFIKKVADFEELWVLENDNGDIAISEVDDHVLLSLWSAPEFAATCQQGIWEQYRPVKLALDDLEDDIFPLVEDEGYLLDVFPVHGRSGFVVSLDEFIRDMDEELERYE